MSRGFRRRQRKTMTTMAASAPNAVRNGCSATKPPVSSDGLPFETVRGRKIATAITMSTLTPVKSDWTTVGDVTPATDEPGMLVRKMPIMAAVPSWAGVTELIAVPPCEALHVVLNDSPERGYAARRMFRQPTAISADSAVFRASATRSQ
jgi:hypothetical protein